MPPFGFEPTISEQPQIYALDRTANGIGKGTKLRNPFSLILLEDLLVLDAVKEFRSITGCNLVLKKMNSLRMVMPRNFTVISLILLSLYSRI